MNQRPRRNRKTSAVREMVAETHLKKEDLIYPLFIIDGVNKKKSIHSMPNCYRWSLDLLLNEIESCGKLGLSNFVLFPSVENNLKDKKATYSYHPKNFYLKAIKEIKKEFPDFSLMSDVAMDPYSSDGHDGLVIKGEIDNDESIPILCEMALAQANAGIDIIGPSDMMDGRVGAIRETLDENNFINTSIMSYTAKYASAFYGPFRDALNSEPKHGDKKTYQMDPRNRTESLVEAELDEIEGADILMIKPALSYLDVIQTLKKNSNLPISAYNVSGEYAMIHAAAEKGWLDYDNTYLEVLTSIKRAGADIILTYFAKDFAKFKN
ncbi:MAG: porphobilinogen synthase [Flavobacteriales bacterium]|nr:porphobilinogen synthase [Flavobacteriales bacterium]MDG1440639.1 porphobilinogen synthase [Flavobacteriales bacterium]MDG1798916.1 porphobilinogen synthase [Flavobacteriales bacterium]